MPGNTGKYVPVALVFVALILTSAISIGAGSAAAQKNSPDATLRTVRGTVTDKGEAPLRSAVVYLKNVRTLTVKTYISGDAGDYRFSGLDPNADYELHAETPDLTSSTHNISSFDSRKEIVVALKVDKEKKKGEK